MAENEDVQVEEVEETEEEIEVLDEETTDWKARAKELERKAILQRAKTKELKSKLAEVSEVKADKKVENKKEGFDYAEKAYLKASGITPDEFPLVQEVMQATGKSLDETLEAKYFQAELKERREAKASKDAIPTGSKRSTSSARDSVDYWLAKDELPPADQRELRQKVVNARIEREKTKSQFTDRPLV